MPAALTHRKFLVGTTGWSLDDLYDPEILWKYSEGRHEIVEGVLTKMAPQGFETVSPPTRLRQLVERQVGSAWQDGLFHVEVDLLLSKRRVVRPDTLYLTPEQHRQQLEAQKKRRLPRDSRYHPVYVAPHLVIESASPRHEPHDRITKREWYATFGIPHYWILTAHEQSLVSLALKGSAYVDESTVVGDQLFSSSAFDAIKIDLSQLWGMFR